MEIADVTPFEMALGLEVRLEATRKGLSHKDIQEATGIQERSFRRYFVKCERHIPVDELAKVADALGLDLTELVRRAQAHVGSVSPAGSRVREVKAQRIVADEPTTATPDQR